MSVSGPKTGAVCRQNFCRQAKNSASFDCFRRYATEVLHTAGPLGSQAFAAPRAIVLHALRTFMPTHVLEQFKNTCGHECSQGVENKCLRRCKTMEKQRNGKLLSRTCRNNRNSCYFSPGDQNFADKTAPVLGSRNGPQNGGHSFSLNLTCLCPDDLAPVLVSVSGPQNGGRLSAKFLPPGEK